MQPADQLGVGRQPDDPDQDVEPAEREDLECDVAVGIDELGR